jgi:sulfoxide reductase heme-binding subunit YedZ
MSVAYQAVGWTPHKKLYDRLLAGAIGVYLAIFLGASFALHPEATAETLLIRAFGSLSLLLLHLVLAIGPLARLDRRFLPLLYNRRHLGVTMFLCATVHGVFALVQFHALGVLPPWVNVLGGNPRWDSLAQFPFEVLGVAALFILFLMAATSHDFWLRSLGAPAWKKLHMLVYAAYALILLHVALGAAQADPSPQPMLMLLGGLAGLLALHLFAGWRERRRDRALAPPPARESWADLAAADSLPEKIGRTFCVGAERIAVFRYDGKVSAISNVCRHQNGPLGEGKIVDGCVVCPWHGYQYRPSDGCSPPPYGDKVSTYRLKVESGRLLADPRPLPPGTPVEPVLLSPPVAPSEPRDEFYVGYLPETPPGTARWVRRVVFAIFAGLAFTAGALAFLQPEFETGTFEFGQLTERRGRLELAPYPVLWLAGEKPAALLLVGQGKHGAERDLAGQDGRHLRVEGSLIYRQGLEMLEIVPEKTAELGGAAPAPPAAEKLGRHRLRGEIVDGKCHLGVMKPGSGKTHKACAILCIRGGAPPLFVVRENGRVVLQALLVGAAGEALGPQILDRVGEPVEAEGELERQGDLLRFRVAPAAIARL